MIWICVSLMDREEAKHLVNLEESKVNKGGIQGNGMERVVVPGITLA